MKDTVALKTHCSLVSRKPWYIMENSVSPAGDEKVGPIDKQPADPSSAQPQRLNWGHGAEHHMGEGSLVGHEPQGSNDKVAQGGGKDLPCMPWEMMPDSSGDRREAKKPRND